MTLFAFDSRPAPLVFKLFDMFFQLNTREGKSILKGERRCRTLKDSNALLVSKTI
jgi:hypothetical protein